MPQREDSIRKSKVVDKLSRSRHNANGLDTVKMDASDMHLIQPWSKVCDLISNAFGIKNYKTIRKMKAEEMENEEKVVKRDEEPMMMLQSGLTLSHGFQLLRSLQNGLATLSSVLYIPHSGIHVSLDSTHLHIWKGDSRIHKISALPPRDRSKMVKSSSLSKNSYLPGIMGVSKWIYIEKMRLYVVATKQLQLKLLDLQFDEMFLFSNPMPVLSMTNTPITGDVICGEVGGIRVFSVQRDE